MSPKPTESGVVLCCCRKENVMVWRWMDEGVNCWMCGRPVCRQTDRQTGGGWSQGGGQTAPGDGGEVTGDRTCSHPSFYSFIYFFLNPLRRSLASPVGPQTCSTRKTNLWSSRLRRLVQKRWMPFFKKKKGKRSKISSPEDWIRGCFKMRLWGGSIARLWTTTSGSAGLIVHRWVSCEAGFDK